MLIPQQARSETHGRYGDLDVSFAELRRQLAKPSMIGNRHRQRLLDLAQRLARVRALGDEYARVELSEFASAALGGSRVVV